jgi:hypothetical protein
VLVKAFPRVVKRLHRVAEERWHCGDRLWRGLLNRDAAYRQRRSPLPVTEIVRDALRGLSTDGVTAFSIDGLSGGVALWQRILDEERQSAHTDASRIAAARADFQSNSGGYKDYLIRQSPGRGTTIGYQAASVEFALHPEILALVNGYLELYSVLRYLEFWHTLADEARSPAYSQLWHRDPEDVHLVKVFLYLNDVGHASGPFWFAKGTHRGRLRWLNPDGVASGRTNRATDEEVAAIVPRNRWFEGTGAAGTVIVADTKGYHRGGFATRCERRLLTASYLSPWGEDVRLPMAITGVMPTAHPAIRFAAGSS